MVTRSPEYKGRCRAVFEKDEEFVVGVGEGITVEVRIDDVDTIEVGTPIVGVIVAVPMLSTI